MGARVGGGVAHGRETKVGNKKVPHMRGGKTGRSIVVCTSHDLSRDGAQEAIRFITSTVHIMVGNQKTVTN